MHLLLWNYIPLVLGRGFWVFNRAPKGIIMGMFISMLCICDVILAMEDPFRPPGYKEKNSLQNISSKSKTWYVNQILTSGNRRIAIINNRAVKVGDKVSGAKVIEIMPSHVVLEYNNKIFESTLMLVHMKKLVAPNADH